MLAAAILMIAPPNRSAAAPSTQPARTGPPDSIAVIGDSISAGTGTSGLPASEQPQNSWSTGTNNNSLYLRILAINPAISGNNQNVAANGNDMTDALAMANQVNLNTELITIQLGGNDLCKSNVSQMTPVATYRSEFVAALNAIKARNPNALIQVSSIPDIFNLWYVRGAPASVNGQESASAGTARTFWNLGLIPCESLVANPTSTDATNNARRNQVRSRGIALNYVLKEECEAVLRCRFDDFATFDFSSNRSDPGNVLGVNRSIDPAPWGNYEGYVPPAQWQFEDADVSTIDHFHPSNSGHRKLAEAAWESGYDYSDTTAPAHVSTTVTPSPLPTGVSLLPPTVTGSWSDAAGVKGVEYRVHDSGGPGPWSFEAGGSTEVDVTATGVRWVEMRALDSNGNMSASRITEVNYNPTLIPVPEISTSPPVHSASTGATFSFPDIPSLSFECSLDGSAFAACPNPISYTGLTEAEHSFAVRHVGPNGLRSDAASFSWTVDVTPPAAPGLLGVPTPRTNSNSASISISGEPLASFECSINSGPFQNCSSALALSALADGGHSVAVRQTDRAGNQSPATTASWIVDTVAPAAPQISGAPPAHTSSTTAVISISSEAGASLRCSVDGGSFSACTSPVVRTGIADGQRSLAVTQTDAAGNTSPVASVTWRVDTVNPTAPTLSGAPIGSTPLTGASIAITGEPFATFQCSFDSGQFQDCTSPVNLTGLANGERSVTVRQRDRAGNTGPPTTVSWTVDAAVSPTVFTQTPAALSNQRNATIAFTGGANASFTCSLDGAPFSPCTSPVSLTGLGDGPRTFAVQQTSTFGSPSPVTTVNWTVDATAPAAPAFSLPPAALISVRLVIARFSGEPESTFECRFDSGQWQPCAGPVVLNELTEGPHSFEARQTDPAGNLGAVARIDWTVDTVAPAAPTLSGAGPGTVRSTSATINLNGEPEAGFECRLNGGPWTGCSSPLPLTGLNQGNQTLESRQSDQAGNTSPISSLTWAVDTVAPRLTGKPKASRKGKVTTLSTKFLRAAGPPATLEYSTSSPRPQTSTAPVRRNTIRWAPTLKINSAPRIRWIRLTDKAGNTSPWYPVG